MDDCICEFGIGRPGIKEHSRKCLEYQAWQNAPRCHGCWAKDVEIRQAKDLIKAAYALGHKHANLPQGSREVLDTDNEVLAEVLGLEMDR